MEIRPMTAAYAMGEIGRPAHRPGGTSGPASFFANITDIVSLGGKSGRNAGLYSGSPMFKIIGAVELMSEDFEPDGEAVGFGDHPVLL